MSNCVEQSGFYDSFIELLDHYFEQKVSQNSSKKVLKNFRDRNDEELLKDSRYRNYLLKHSLPKIEAVKLFAEPLMSKVCKPQKLLANDDEYYVATDLATSTYYVCFRRLLMIDIDFYKDTDSHLSLAEILSKVTSYCQVHPELRFRVFRSNGGIHLFAINQPYDYKKDSTIQLMLDLECDFYYVVYSYIRGYSVRLNPKTVESEDKCDIVNDSKSSNNMMKNKLLYTELEPIGQGNSHPDLNKLVELHLNLCTVFSDVQPSMMFGKAI